VTRPLKTLAYIDLAVWIYKALAYKEIFLGCNYHNFDEIDSLFKNSDTVYRPVPWFLSIADLSVPFVN
jgi:hypothetical protein